MTSAQESGSAGNRNRATNGVDDAEVLARHRLGDHRDPKRMCLVAGVEHAAVQQWNAQRVEEAGPASSMDVSTSDPGCPVAVSATIDIPVDAIGRPRISAAASTPGNASNRRSRSSKAIFAALSVPGEPYIGLEDGPPSTA
jgi:hypothetical protein